MLKEIIAGILVGIANVIPGVSGGTMLVICGVFEKMTTSVSDLTSKDASKRKEAIVFLAKLLVGVGIGVIVFAKLLNIVLFRYIPVQTLFWFMGMVFFSAFIFLKREMKNQKLNYVTLLLGVGVIALIMVFAPEKSKVVLDTLPEISMAHLVLMVIIGIIGGFSMIIPGVSGSLVLLIIGQYYLFTTYIAKVTTFQLNVLIPLFCIGIGVLIGIFLSAKLCKYLFEVAPVATNSFILGLILASTYALIPFKSIIFGFPDIISYVVAFIIGGVLVICMDMFLANN